MTESSKQKVVVIVQARMGSTRLPGKSLMLLAGKPVVEHVTERAKKIPYVSEVWLATTTEGKDDSLAAWAESKGLNCFRGSPSDVLDRYYQTAKLAGADVIVRVTGDCPLLDPEISGQVVSAYLNDKVDYVTNTKPPTYPDGMDTECFSFDALEKAWREANMQSEREHVTPYIWKNSQIFRAANVENKRDLSSLRLTLDTKEDFLFLDKIISECSRAKTGCSLKAIDSLLAKNPEWKKINDQYQRDEGYAKSLREDKKIKN